MADLAADIRNFLAVRQAFERRARQMAAFRLATGLDLSAALAAEGDERHRIVRKLERIIERERLRGAAGHWSYDVNRHIALKQVLDDLLHRPRRQCPDDGSKRRANEKRRPRRRFPEPSK